MRSTLPLLYPAWLVAIVATVGSLYFSEVRMFVPCVLCWYQRILMYPLVLLLGVQTYRQDGKAFAYTLPLAVLGLIIAGYHVLYERIPNFGFQEVCRGGVPCDVIYINWLGFITIPVLSLTAFTIITTLLALSLRAARRQSRA